MALKFANPSGGVSPLGKITVTTAATPVALNTNTGPQSQGALQMTKRFRQVGISAAIANTGNIYVMFGNNPVSTTPQACLCEIPPGQVRYLPDGLLVTSQINIDNLWLDTNVSGSIAYAFGVYG